MKCKNCGTEFEGGLFCPECGSRQEAQGNPEKKDNPPAYVPNQNTTPKKNKTLPVIGGVIGAVAVLGLLITILGGSENKTEPGNQDVQAVVTETALPEETVQETPENQQAESGLQGDGFIGCVSEYVDISGEYDVWIGAMKILMVREDSLTFEMGMIDENGYRQIVVADAEIVAENHAVYDSGYGFGIDFQWQDPLNVLVNYNGEITGTDSGVLMDITDRKTYSCDEEIIDALANELGGTYESEYVLPDSDIVFYTEEDLWGLTKEECKIARNEIYARHGRLFQDEQLQAYFDSCSWYYGYISGDEFSEDMLSEIEKHNRDLIIAYETEMGYR